MSAELTLIGLLVVTYVSWCFVFWRQRKVNKIVYDRFEIANKRITNVEALATTAMMGSVAPLLEKLGSKMAEAAKRPDVNAPASGDPPSEV